MIWKGIILALLLFTPVIIAVIILIYALYCYFTDQKFFGYDPEDCFDEVDDW